MSPIGGCPFCGTVAVDAARIVAGNELAFAIRDGFPVSPGHTLVIPRRHVVDWWGSTPAERSAIDALVDQVRRDLNASHAPAGYNVGVNMGAAAGQTVFHLHVHVIPRYDGDVHDPRGGVRHVIPGMGNYLEARTSSPVEVATVGVESADLMQRVLAILTEGRRSATYKPALLLALVDLATERSRGTESLALPLDDIAERVMELYWPQTRPHPMAPGGTLRQATTRNSRILGALGLLRAQSGASPGHSLGRVRLSHPDRFADARARVAAALAKQPIPRLQRPGTGHGVASYPRFLYDDSRFVAEKGPLDREPSVVLQPGVAQALARSAALIRVAAQDVWTREVAAINRLDLEEQHLRDFLFGATRTNLREVADGLLDSGVRDCFWCGGRLAREVEVDHVIPWSHNPHDDLFNLVLADRACNNDKRERLVTSDLIRRWLERDIERIRALGGELRWQVDPLRSQAIARSAYAYLAEGMPVWRGRKDLILFDRDQRRAVLELLA